MQEFQNDLFVDDQILHEDGDAEATFPHTTHDAIPSVQHRPGLELQRLGAGRSGRHRADSRRPDHGGRIGRAV